jgi:Ca-activated chloride channel family protein
MELRFAPEYTSIAVVLMAIAVVLFILSRRWVKKRALRFGNFEVLEKVLGGRLLPMSLVPLIMRLTILGLLVVSISDPQIIYDAYVPDRDFVLAIDTSSSMLTSDMEPNRLEAAKELSTDIVGRMEGNLVGVVSFAGKAYVQVGPIEDKLRVKTAIKNVDLDTPGGTAIGDALVTSTSLLTGVQHENKTILLITDGINNMGVQINETYDSLKNNGISVYAIGIGSRTASQPGAVPEGIENATEAEFPMLDETSLQELANETEGKYFRVVDIETFRRALESGVEFKENVVRLSTYIVAIASILVLVEWLLLSTRYRTLP